MLGTFRPKTKLNRGDRFNGFHPDALSWRNRVITNNGGKVSLNTLKAISEFCKVMDSTGLKQKMKSLCVFVPDSLAAAICPVYKSFGYDIWYNTNFETSDLTINGLKGNASNKYLSTGVVARDAMTATSNGVSAYVSETVHQLGFDAGCDDSTSGYFEFSTNWSDTADPDGAMLFCDETYGATNQLAVGFRNPDSLCYGYFSGNRTPGLIDIYFANSQTPHVAHPNGVQTGYSNTTAKTTNLPNAGITFFCSARYNGTVPSYISSRRLSMAALHNGLTAAESKMFYDFIHLCRQRIGGGWR